ncbi:exopolysaccharide production protein YjbE [Candidatus Pantoea floridensis]|uniref:Exopolysaccharide production protein YjbE n=1 Tax=Candidatus Pantoea floridensis TaxID=1938870 RepID=A0A286BUE0_9GAMM|nr:exopolysaccharide production protein YjbE [Pantoea floridensis]PIF13673.1 exopolysaccharide production protein YjbE [Enterobacteriaceae bacterium JKS000233]SOD37772.1 Exopolysaccharide production protein YjbE [Pantoea floridensis]
MKKTVILLGALMLTSITQVQAATSAGEAAGAQASTTAKGNSDAIGIGAVGALLGVALATIGGGDKGSSGTSTTTATAPGK